MESSSESVLSSLQQPARINNTLFKSGLHLNKAVQFFRNYQKAKELVKLLEVPLGYRCNSKTDIIDDEMPEFHVDPLCAGSSSAFEEWCPHVWAPQDRGSKHVSADPGSTSHL
ncbi:hypothetical protein H4Q26_005720 [Puccinia striiformis f. sp. tritici PST-130]|uniref:Uncharacterized protein n=1 Tax=Puccinia striiformis f. sp. tritici PST-78 TaxID=1165861 RepID=A0A0L0VSG3_9BASI|nr:hypothetical protein H4Q26_005720 [Puccinia striiformis f. sp. tritici PST-130]KNF02223.1 hypothetical protein PSTG_04722 [Puccinia striiformis f. sp. tritici PST-78]